MRTYNQSKAALGQDQRIVFIHYNAWWNLGTTRS